MPPVDYLTEEEVVRSAAAAVSFEVHGPSAMISVSKDVSLLDEHAEDEARSKLAAIAERSK